MEDNSTANSTLAESTRMTASYASSVGCQEEIVPCTTAASTYLISYVELVRNKKLKYTVDRRIFTVVPVPSIALSTDQ